ncbi:hypothetical protein [Lysinibacillus sp. C5.1]|uniref:hypothetical protein n=1 Tax=Lysinibacillus sp. C5.1 TaxID=2796169 RepID=UPI00308148B2
MINDRIFQIEEEVDKYLFNFIDGEIPRYKYIYHINLVYIDYVIENKLWFSQMEKHLLFSLNYNIYLAYCKLEEEDVFSFNFDSELYLKCYRNLIIGMEYSMLCDVFQLIRSGKIKHTIDEKNRIVRLEYESFPRDKHEFLTIYLMKKSLSYTLQTTAGMLENEEQEDAASKLANGYLNFWNENLVGGDFEPYSMMEWGAVNYFFVLASMRRFVKLYRNDFNLDIVASNQVMVKITSANKIYDFLCDGTLPIDRTRLELVMNDLIYKPVGNELFPKSSFADAPIIKTKDGILFLNPIVLLSNVSNETMYLNNLRKTDTARYMRIKDKIKERIIPLIEALIKIKYPKAKFIMNFNLPIPNNKKQKRELDVLIIDEETGFVLYVEVKHFFLPVSFSEIKNVDIELKKALKKMPDQLLAIKEGWGILQKNYGVITQCRAIKGIVLSHSYLGKDVEIDEETPIVNVTNFFESLAESNTIEELYLSNKSIDDIYNSLVMEQHEMKFSYAKYEFNYNSSIISPIYEQKFLESYRKIVFNNIELDAKDMFTSLEEHAKAILDKMNQSNLKI